MTLDLNCSIIRPFGPAILKITIPSDIVKNVNDFADNQQNKIDNKDQLASLIEDVPQISHEQLEQLGLNNLFLESSRHYLQSVTKHKSVDVRIIASWINNQMENEYNPVHYHMNCKVSAVLYLKIPNYKDRGFNEDLDGHIDFIYGATDYNGLFSGNFCHKPKEGDLLIFPSSLFHTVYPFKGKGIRRTLAFNVDFNTIEESN